MLVPFSGLPKSSRNFCYVRPDRSLVIPYIDHYTIESYDTLSDAINALRAQGYTEDFNLKENCIECLNGAHQVTPAEFKIDKSFRFDVDEDPSDQSVLYAISSEKYHLKGVLVSGYGIYSDRLTNDMLDKLK